MFLFLVSTLGCVYSQTALQFVGWRLVQGIAGASGIVISRLDSRRQICRTRTGKDVRHHRRHQRSGSGSCSDGRRMLAESIGWQGIFWCLFCIGILLLAGSFHLTESLPAANRRKTDWADVFRGFGAVLRNRQYLCYILQFGFAQGVFIRQHIVRPVYHARTLWLLADDVQRMLRCQCAGNCLLGGISVRFRHPELVLYRGSQGMLAVSILLLAAMGSSCSFWIYETLLLCLLVMLGLTFTSSNTLAMNAERQHAGTASAVLGALGFAFGGIVSPLVGIATSCFLQVSYFPQAH